MRLDWHADQESHSRTDRVSDDRETDPDSNGGSNRHADEKSHSRADRVSDDRATDPDSNGGSNPPPDEDAPADPEPDRVSDTAPV